MKERRRILLVDDDPEVVDRMKQLLDDDFEVKVTTDWGEVSKIVFREVCHLVLMDVNLPVLKGDRLVQILQTALKAKKDGPRPKIVYFSAEDESTLARLVRETGADGYIAKGLRSPQMVAEVARYAVA